MRVLPLILSLALTLTPFASVAKPIRQVNPLLLELAKQPKAYTRENEPSLRVEGYRFIAYADSDEYFLAVYKGNRQVDKFTLEEKVFVVELKKIKGRYRAYVIPPACWRHFTPNKGYVGAPTECDFPKDSSKLPWVDAVYLR